MPATARTALLGAAYREREDAVTRLAEVHEALAFAEQHNAALIRFLALFARYRIGVVTDVAVLAGSAGTDRFAARDRLWIAR